ncbi:MAG: hypothetical protein ACK58Z_20335 [Pseudanabaena sp.]
MFTINRNLSVVVFIAIAKQSQSDSLLIEICKLKIENFVPPASRAEQNSGLGFN